ncbi:type II toxin-antitoxin system death-on-curing family toxin [Azospirillum agricola]|uniref:type II toxin-antitoxin system death-on-curing family toxin n=1 Tax=Azospirillum agricola TaxID=1720247 RepID=UPI000A0F0DAA|nr:type II toxin-antitoxin system death-on-curing family toxin [Azospirillum agricola]SMH29541.1 death on curing protein [Azospirillum lipoferum]
MTSWRLVGLRVTLAVHDRQLAEHGGGEGVRDLGLLESALARAENLIAYGQPDAADLAAAYGFGIARNHPFVDGNKRTAFVIVLLFLLDNGYRLTASDADAYQTMMGVADGTASEEEFATWIRTNIQPV